MGKLSATYWLDALGRTVFGNIDTIDKHAINVAWIEGTTLHLEPGRNYLSPQGQQVIDSVAGLGDGDTGSLRIQGDDGGVTIRGESWDGNLFCRDTEVPFSAVSFWRFEQYGYDCFMLQVGPSKEF